MQRPAVIETVCAAVHAVTKLRAESLRLAVKCCVSQEGFRAKLGHTAGACTSEPRSSRVDRSASCGRPRLTPCRRRHGRWCDAFIANVTCRRPCETAKLRFCCEGLPQRSGVGKRCQTLVECLRERLPATSFVSSNAMSGGADAVGGDAMHLSCLLPAMASAFQSSRSQTSTDTALTSGRYKTMPTFPSVCAVAAVDPEVGRTRRRPRRFLGFTWTEFKLLSCVVAVMCLAINGKCDVPSVHPCYLSQHAHKRTCPAAHSHQRCNFAVQAARYSPSPESSASP